MRKLILLIPACASLLSGCVTTPPLSQATGAEDSRIMIKDVVQRLKCELSEAFDQKTEEPGLEWLAMWTAHVDLALAINDNSGISPNGSFTDFRRSAVNFDAGPSSYPFGTARSIAQQFLTVSAGVALSGQAVRTETVSFTVSLEELKEWRRELDLREANVPPEARICNFPPSTGLTGNLGLKEWVDSAFFPARKDGELAPGLHKAEWLEFPISIADATDYAKKLPDRLKRYRIPKPLTPESRDYALVEDKYKHLPLQPALQRYTDVAKWQSELKNVQTATKDAMNTIATSSEKIYSNILAVSASKFEANKRYRSVMKTHLADRYNDFIDKLTAKAGEALKCNSYKDTLDRGLINSYEILPPAFQNVKMGGGDGSSSNDILNQPSGGDGSSSNDAQNRANGGGGSGSNDAKNQPSGGGSSDLQKALDEIKKMLKEHVASGKGSKDLPNLCMPGPGGKPNEPPCPILNEKDAKENYRVLGAAAEVVEGHDFYKKVVECAKGLTMLADYISTYINTFPPQVDPPVDSVLHSLQFVITYGANVTPSWTLLQWKGPGQTGNFVAAMGTRTHNLQLALGPRSGAAPISQDATRLIQNQTVKSLGNTGGGG